MKYGRYGWSHRFMRWGLGITFIWIGVDILQHPQNWIGYVPADLPIPLSREDMLHLSGILDAAVGILFILGWWVKTSALFASVHLAAIISINGINAVIIRDVGLLGLSLALFTWPSRYRKHRLFKLFHRKKPKAPPVMQEEPV